ncbi:MAG: hypothetical protein Q8N06_17520 [Hydrogenophaga sp.]|nr:hypothetical protein [Hydrogenophaga sp.]
MMGKAAQRKRASKAAPIGDVHARIAAEAKAVQAIDRMGFQDAEKTPALEALLDSATLELTGRIPSTFQHEGRAYYLRVAIVAARVMVFENATAPQPMAMALTGSHEEFGHLPYH